jgi:hypothetical protein
MPLPLLLLAGAAVATAGYGVKKGIDAKSDFDSAKYWNEEAQKIYDEAQKKLQNKRKSANNAMEALGKTKYSIYNELLIPFVYAFDKIKNVNFNDNFVADIDRKYLISKEDFLIIRSSALAMKDVVSGGIAALGSGGLAGLATYGGIGLLGTASTGTAISTLGGVAATNATLAWLGGGSLAAGGLGMAGGMAVLGGIVAAPVLGVGGMLLASKAEAAKEDAYANHSKAELAAEEMKSAGVAVDAIKKRFQEINNILIKLDDIFAPLLISLQELVSVNQNYEMYSEEDKKGVFIAVSTAKLLKGILETPIIDEDGQLTSESRRSIIQTNLALNKMT